MPARVPSRGDVGTTERRGAATFQETFRRSSLNSAGKFPRSDHAQASRQRAERRAGQLIAEMEKAKGARGSGSNQHQVRSHDATAPSLSDLGISKQQSSDWQKLADIPDREFEQALKSSRAVICVQPPPVYFMTPMYPPGNSVSGALMWLQWSNFAEPGSRQPSNQARVTIPRPRSFTRF